jgi:hypothetical protein
MNAEQIRAALADAMVAHDADGMTMHELCAALGYRPTEGGLRSTRHKVRELMELGLIVHAGNRAGVRIDGVPTRSPVYRITGPSVARPGP